MADKNTSLQQDNVVVPHDRRTTLLVPEALWMRAKRAGLEMNISLRKLMLAGLELKLNELGVAIDGANSLATVVVRVNGKKKRAKVNHDSH